MRAGIDFGTSLVKAAWIKEENYVFRSTANEPLEELVEEMKDAGITNVGLAGIGHLTFDYEDMLKSFNISTKKGDPIDVEKKLQIEGIRRLMRYQGNKPNSFVLVSIGTGTSYTLRKFGFTIPVPLGNAFGGGFIEGISKIAGVDNFQEMSRLASEGKPLDIYVKDKVPSLRGEDLGEYVLSHFGRATKDSYKGDVLASAVAVVSATIAKDLAVLSHFSKFFKWTKDIIYIGSVVSNFPSLRSSLEKYSLGLGKRPHFPENGEYALAVGASLL